jgi:hypothetical protein
MVSCQQKQQYFLRINASRDISWVLGLITQFDGTPSADLSALLVSGTFPEMWSFSTGKLMENIK